MSFKIIGTGSALPEFTLTNAMLSEMVDTSDEWITTRTGIGARQICTHETVTGLSAAAARRALENAGLAPEELDMIICATVRGDTLSPSLACMVQKEIGAGCPAFDINAACTGFIYALDLAEAYYKAGKLRHILIVSAEAMSLMTDWNDRATCVLFGDGAGAAVLAPGDGLKSIRLTARGADACLNIPAPTGESPFYKGLREPYPYTRMNGQEVYKFAVNAMHHDICDVLEAAAVPAQAVDWVMVHQANKRIIDAAKSKLPISPEKFLCTIEKYGNISSATIPIMLDEHNRSGQLKTGDTLVFSAFGGGLTTGAAVFNW